jgi:hypothetical protein
LLEWYALDLERTFLPSEDAKASAVGTGPLLAQRLGLLFEEGLEGSFRKSGGRGVSDLLHGAEIDIESGSFVAESASGDDFAPLSGEAVEFLEFVGGEGARGHDASCPGVESKTKEKRVPSN